jgi:hypothetical protein
MQLPPKGVFRDGYCIAAASLARRTKQRLKRPGLQGATTADTNHTAKF